MSVMPDSRQIGEGHRGRVSTRQEKIMIGTAAKIVFGLIVGVAMLVAVTIALCADLLAPETF
jgi:hypothetical protein